MATKNIIDRLNQIRTSNRSKQRRSKTVNLLIGASIGTALGATAGVLFAPRSGKETRENISQKTAETLDNVKKNIMDAKNKVFETIMKKSPESHDFTGDRPESAEEATKEG